MSDAGLPPSAAAPDDQTALENLFQDLIEDGSLSSDGYDIALATLRRLASRERAAAMAGTPTDAEKKELEWRRYQMEHNWPRNQFGSLLTQGEWAALAGTAPADTLKPFAHFAAMWDENPVGGRRLADSHIVYGIHTGTQWEAHLTLGDFRRAALAVGAPARHAPLNLPADRSERIARAVSADELPISSGAPAAPPDAVAWLIELISEATNGCLAYWSEESSCGPWEADVNRATRYPSEAAAQAKLLAILNARSGEHVMRRTRVAEHLWDAPADSGAAPGRAPAPEETQIKAMTDDVMAFGEFYDRGPEGGPEVSGGPPPSEAP